MEPHCHEQILPARAVQPLCPVFGECQGCCYQDISYPDELKAKERWLKDLLKGPLDIPESRFDPIVPSPKPYYYRNRIDLKLKRTRERGILIGFTPVNRRGILPVEACSIAEEKISAFIPQLKKEAVARLTDKYRVANLVVRTGDDGRVLWGGIGRRSCELPAKDYLWTEVAGRRIFYSLDTFFQANLSILPALFDVIRSLDLWDPKPVFYDLYGGVGFFGVGLAREAARVVLIEENPSSLKVAHYNKAVNNLEHFEIIEGKVEEALACLLDGEANAARVAMIDPPRAGLSPRACALLSGMPGLGRVLYLSCNPESLARDLKTFLQQGWTVVRIIPFDFFPKTKHLETLAVLSAPAGPQKS